MATIIPSREELARLPGQGLTPGEWAVLDRLDDGLQGDWNVWVQPHLVGHCPDFVVGHPQHGIVAIEVKDWAQGLYQARPDAGIEVLKDDRWTYIPSDPIAQVDAYRSAIQRDIHIPERSVRFSVIRGVVVMTRMTQQHAEDLLRRGTHMAPNDARWIRVEGREFLEGDIADWRHRVLGRGDVWVGGPSFERLIGRLAESQSVQDERRPLQFSVGARNIASNPNSATIRRVRGPAGSGKTIGLAARSAELAGRGHRVLVATYNITLGHYVLGVLRRHAREIDADHRLVTVAHIHGMAARLLRAHAVPFPGVENLIEAAQKLYEERNGNGLPTFDSILVDEGQDFTVDWWNFLRQHVWKPRRDDGEMLLVADQTQSLYEHANAAWTDEDHQLNAGFRGPWARLEGTYRNTPDLTHSLARFAALHLPDADLPAVPTDIAPGLASTHRDWINVPPGKHIDHVVLKLLELHQSDHVVDGDVLFMTTNHESGVLVAELLESEGVAMEHVFHLDKEERQRLKRAFWPGRATMKGSTVHSAKGWEKPHVVVLLEPGEGVDVEAYIAISRACRFADGITSGSVTVLNTVASLADFVDDFTA